MGAQMQRHGNGNDNDRGTEAAWERLEGGKEVQNDIVTPWIQRRRDAAWEWYENVMEKIVEVIRKRRGLVVMAEKRYAVATFLDA